MQTKTTLELADAQAMLERGRREADANGWAVAIAVVDDGGHALLVARLDGCPPLFAEVAVEKARSAALADKPTRAMEDSINDGRAAFLSVPGIHATMTGGLPVARDGAIAGAVGASGVKPDQDERVAGAALEALRGKSTAPAAS